MAFHSYFVLVIFSYAPLNEGFAVGLSSNGEIIQSFGLKVEEYRERSGIAVRWSALLGFLVYLLFSTVLVICLYKHHYLPYTLRLLF